MRKLYDEFFYIPKHGKIREKVLLVRLSATVAVIVMCLAAMCFSAYAYFSYDITSQNNTVKTAKFVTSVTVTAEDGSTVALTTSNNRTFSTDELVPGKTYTVTVTPMSQQSSVTTGFVIIEAKGCNEVYHTAQLGVDKNAQNRRTDQLVFELTITKATEVTFKTHWGTSSDYPAYSNTNQSNKIIMIVDGVTLSEVKSEDETPPDNGGGASESKTDTPNSETGEPTDTEQSDNEGSNDEEPVNEIEDID